MKQLCRFWIVWGFRQRGRLRHILHVTHKFYCFSDESAADQLRRAVTQGRQVIVAGGDKCLKDSLLLTGHRFYAATATAIVPGSKTQHRPEHFVGR